MDFSFQSPAIILSVNTGMPVSVTQKSCKLKKPEKDIPQEHIQKQAENEYCQKFESREIWNQENWLKTN